MALRKKILVVDDDPTPRLLIVRVLERSGYTCIECSNGRIALEVLRDNPSICGIITDMVMPQMDGRALIEAVMADEKLSRIPIIITSGAVSARSVKDLLIAGAERFVPKPINPVRLLGYVSELVNGQQDAQVEA